MLLKSFAPDIVLTLAALVGGFLLGGPSGLAIVAILIVLEVSLSFDNAVVNATILKRMNAFWQKIFLTVGVLIAVFGMRLIFPLAIVSLTAGLNPVRVVELALDGGDIHTPGTYAYLLHEAHASIAAFGGMFLLMLFLDFVFEDHDVKWLKPLEKPLAKMGMLERLSVIVALLVLAVVSQMLAKDPGEVLFSGLLGVLIYLLVGGLGDLFEKKGAPEGDDEEFSGPNTTAQVGGKAAFFMFMYLEVLDASFSFDGVIGAFAITQDIFIIMIGLGVGALWIRSMTVYLVRKGTLDNYAYLEHGAMWAIGALATILLITIKYEVPEVVTGLVGVTFISAAFLGSIRRNKRIEAQGGEIEHVHA